MDNAVGSGTDVAAATADFILVNSNPLAAGVLYRSEILISPEVGAILVSLSTVIAAINARPLRVKKEELAEVTA
ncbi:MAG: hypothetical protein WD492_02900 [Alkalispirochaeta sp.]